MSESEIEAHNARESWRDVANHLRVAHESIEQAQAGLEDLGMTPYADQLEDMKNELRRAANDAAEQGEQ